MKQEVQTIQITCDRCRTTVIYTPLIDDKPDGWKVISVGPCGMTDYYRNEDRCPACMELERKEAS